MKELVELEKNASEFEKRNTRIVVASLEDPETARLTQADFPHLIIVADPEQKLSQAFQVLHEGVHTPDGKPANAPTTFLVDANGTVRWVFRPSHYIARLSPRELAAAIDAHLPAG